MIFILNPLKKSPHNFNTDGVCYVTEKEYVLHKTYLEENNKTSALNVINIANLTYLVDGATYWIDDYEEGEYEKFPRSAN